MNNESIEPSEAENKEQLFCDILLSPAVVADKYLILKEGPGEDNLKVAIEKIAKRLSSHLLNYGEVSMDTFDFIKRSTYGEDNLGLDYTSFCKKIDEFKEYQEQCMISGKRVCIGERDFYEAEKLVKSCKPALDGYLYMSYYAAGKEVDSSTLGRAGIVNGQLFKQHGKLTIGHSVALEMLYLLNSKTMGDRQSVSITGVADSLIFNPEAKTITVNMVRLVNEMDDFPTRYLKERMDIMSGLFSMILNRSDVTLKLAFLVVDKMGRTFQFMVSGDSFKKNALETIKAMDESVWHIRSKSYYLPYKYQKHQIVL